MDERWNRIISLDLNAVRQKFEFHKGFWWRLRNSAERVEQQYRQFLFLVASNPGQTVVPWSRDVDDFWHEHILDTSRYARDCQAMLGQFIHHNPNLPEGSPAHGKAFAATRKMYKNAFRESVLKGRRRTADDVGCAADMAVVFCAGGTAVGPHHDSCQHAHGANHGGGFLSTAHDAGGHGGGHGGSHGCGGHGCGGHH